MILDTHRRDERLLEEAELRSKRSRRRRNRHEQDVMPTTPGGNCR
jgi:hypothetical protein